jgi:hypothetical protein
MTANPLKRRYNINHFGTKSDYFEYNFFILAGPFQFTNYIIVNVISGINSIPKGIMGLKIKIWILIPKQ